MQPPKPVFRLVAVIVGLALAGLMVACGGDDDATAPTGEAADVAEFQEEAERFMEPVTEFPGPTSGPAAEPDKSVHFIVCGFAAEGCKLPGEGAEAAAEALGWDIRVVDGRFDPRVYNRAISEAVDAEADGIILDAISSEAVAGTLAEAREAGIPVGSLDSANDPAPDGVDYEVIASPEDQGRAMASYMVWQTGQADAFILDAPEFKAVTAWLGGTRDVFDECDTCEIAVDQDMTAEEAATRVPELAVSTLRQNPDINVFIGPYDAALLQTIPSLQQAGLLERVRIGTFNGISPAMQQVRDGLQAATAAYPMEWGAWAAMDNLNRIFAGEEPVEQDLPIRLITEENIDTIEPGEPWTGDVDYEAAYEAIWNP